MREREEKGRKRDQFDIGEIDSELEIKVLR